YLIESLPKDLKDFKQLKQLHLLRKELKEFSKRHLTSMHQNMISEKLSSFTQPIMEEGIWVQFLFLLHFWAHDTSPNFEKTDIIIEKTVVTSFDLMNTKPLESLVDLGKFLWKEKM
ncbi:MAG: TetR/AcrR family transcriptional regulator, partial [Crocinitomicaceae bacterium]|nr:TetR/AcrR family transcriptional regulator [Crocinitomicaceae bacterium]